MNVQHPTLNVQFNFNCCDWNPEAMAVASHLNVESWTLSVPFIGRL